MAESHPAISPKIRLQGPLNLLWPAAWASFIRLDWSRRWKGWMKASKHWMLALQELTSKAPPFSGRLLAQTHRSSKKKGRLFFTQGGLSWVKNGIFCSSGTVCILFLVKNLWNLVNNKKFVCIGCSITVNQHPVASLPDSN